VKATVTSAQALTPEQLKELTAKLQKHVDSGESLKVETKVDPRLVGGFTVAMGEDFFDLSLMSRIRQMEAELAKPIGA
jgi:F-type H+-transporting ATPase subunit O